eukprot:6310979-Amphidinium_carterae.1
MHLHVYCHPSNSHGTCPALQRRWPDQFVSHAQPISRRICERNQQSMAHDMKHHPGNWCHQCGNMQWLLFKFNIWHCLVPLHARRLPIITL